MNKEYGLIMLKPDGNNDEVIEKLKSILAINEFEIVEVRDYWFEENEIEKNFYFEDRKKDYVSYMTSGVCKTFLVNGPNAGYRLSHLKKHLRGMYGFKKGDMRNLIHTPDNGLEYNRQFNTIFKDLNIYEYTAFADLNVRLEEDIPFVNQLEDIEKNTSLSFVAIKQELYKDPIDLNLFRHKGRTLRTALYITNTFSLEGITYNFLGYLPEKYNLVPVSFMKQFSSIREFIEEIHFIGGKILLDYIDYSYYCENLIRKLGKYGLDGFLVHDNRRIAQHAHLIDDIVHDLGYLFSGGSNGHSSVGEISIGERAFSKIYNLPLI